ncbi:MAG: hypothetical protein K5663_06475 [Clostridiales bacterium]|nr:hypothetical protein [Clostridiales bacterium]
MEKEKSSDYIYIFRAFITLKDGTRLYARQHGKKAFRIAVPVEHQD